MEILQVFFETKWSPEYKSLVTSPFPSRRFLQGEAHFEDSPPGLRV